MADQEKQRLSEALEVKRQQREQESQAQERMLQQKAGKTVRFQRPTMLGLYPAAKYSISRHNPPRREVGKLLPYLDHSWIFLV